MEYYVAVKIFVDKILSWEMVIFFQKARKQQDPIFVKEKTVYIKQDTHLTLRRNVTSLILSIQQF